MDVATDKGLFNFLNSLDEDEKEAGTLPQVSPAVTKEKYMDDWSDIADALDVLDAGSCHNTSQDFQQQIGINSRTSNKW